MKLISLIIFLIPFIVIAQDEILPLKIDPIATDRPLQSESAVTVPKKYMQAETGGYFEHTELKAYFTDRSTSQTLLIPLKTTTVFTGPNLLLKYGLLRNFEVRLTLNYISTKVRHSQYSPTAIVQYTVNSSGLESPLVGFKYAFMEEGKRRPAMSFSTHIYVPFGDGDFVEDRLNAFSRLTISKKIKGSWYVTTGLGAKVYDQNLNETIWLVQSGISAFDNFTFILEYYNIGQINRFNNTMNPMGAINGGVIYVIGENHQVDLSAGTSLDGLGPHFDTEHPNYYDFYISVGYSCRLKL